MGWDYRPLPARPVHLVLEATPLLLLATNLLTATDQTAVPPSLSPVLCKHLQTDLMLSLSSQLHHKHKNVRVHTFPTFYAF